MQIFKYDSWFMQLLTRLADMIILNVLFIICSIPLFTIGAAHTAVYSVTLKMVKNREGYVFKSFFKAFKDNFKISTICWLLFCILGGFLYADGRMIPKISGNISPFVRIAVTAVGIIALLIFAYIFPYIARFEDSLKTSLKNSFVIAIVNLPYTIIILAITIVPVVATIMIGLEKVGIFWIMLGFGLVPYVNSFILRKVFYKYEPHDNIGDGDEGSDGNGGDEGSDGNGKMIASKQCSITNG